MYVRNFSDGLDVSWQHFFQTEDRAVVEETCRKQGFICEWVGKDDLRVKQRCRAVLRHPVTGELTFFNQVQLHHVHCLDPEVRDSLLSIFKREDLPRHVYYGDGSEIEDVGHGSRGRNLREERGAFHLARGRHGHSRQYADGSRP